jgi:hypothetical protein
MAGPPRLEILADRDRYLALTVGGDPQLLIRSSGGIQDLAARGILMRRSRTNRPRDPSAHYVLRRHPS